MLHLIFVRLAGWMVLLARSTASKDAGLLAGWIARALEAYAGGGPLRPRAVYAGPPAIVDP